MKKGKIYPYMKIKKQINVNISKKILEEMDYERNICDFTYLDYPSTRSEFVQRAIINYIIYLRNNREKFMEKKKDE